MDCEKFMGMIDDYVDSCISEADKSAMLEHARVCEGCAAELRRAERLKQVLTEIDAGISVPFTAQAAWRGAVKRLRKQRIYRAVTAIAAALVLMLGVGAGIRAFNDDKRAEKIGFIATDGAPDETGEPGAALTREIGEPAEQASAKIASTDVGGSANTVCELVNEYNGTVSIKSINGGTAYISASMPAAEMPQFMAALDYAGNVLHRHMSDDAKGAVNVKINIVKPSN